MDYIYLDDAATTRVDDRVKKAMDEYYDKKYGNPSSLHKMGKEAKKAMKHAREKTASLIGADIDEIIFT
ncbi:MAG: aminotransferase class V-fold PLP-dependent enzyme, partial [Thermoplasmatota archaeon]